MIDSYVICTAIICLTAIIGEIIYYANKPDLCEKSENKKHDWELTDVRHHKFFTGCGDATYKCKYCQKVKMEEL